MTQTPEDITEKTGKSAYGKLKACCVTKTYRQSKDQWEIFAIIKCRRTRFAHKDTH